MRRAPHNRAFFCYNRGMDPRKVAFGRTTLWHLALIVVATAVYGAVLAVWRSPLMAAYGAVKLPLVFFATTLLVTPLCWMASLLAASGLRFREVFAAAMAAMAVAGSLLLALAPIWLFFILTGAPDSGTREEMRFAHAILLLVHIVTLAVAGTVGVVALCRALRARVAPSCRFRLMMAVWLLAFGIVGCQVGWVLRPLVGSPNIAVEFVRDDALESNFIESFATQIIPHIAHKGAVRK